MRTPRWAPATLFLVATAGCSTVAPFDGPGPVPPSTAGVRSFPTSPKLIDRTIGAMEDVGVHSIVRREVERGTLLEGRTASGRRASVVLRPGGETTSVASRFGPIGDEPLSRAFVDRLAARTGTGSDDPGPAPAPAVAKAPAPRRTTPNRAASPPSTLFERQHDGGFRDSVSP